MKILILTLFLMTRLALAGEECNYQSECTDKECITKRVCVYKPDPISIPTDQNSDWCTVVLKAQGKCQ